ncbi:MAG: cytochrome c oxidase accessory protein CcoG [Vicinamibacteraceae bacterium]
MTIAAESLEEHQTFRDELASVGSDGRRRWVYARQPSGRFYRARTMVSWGLIGFLVSAPFIRINGLPLVLLNVVERRFALFGLLFWPQDFFLVVLLALTGIVGLALSTVAVGRVWCGWLCPQTVFLEMVFRKIEFVIDGTAAQQLRRDRGSWTAGRVWRAALKHAIFFALSFGIANLFLAYVIGTESLGRIITTPPHEHLVGLLAITIFSGLFYAVFARFREQACVLVCPYGRVMSSLIDRRTITVTYDTVRGEPRQRMTHGPAPRPAGGDCVDCHQCVTVCPTGIDVRNGPQLECVACTACIDACDEVMTKVGRPTGLIRYDSHDAMQGLARRGLSPRIVACAAVWLALVMTVTILIAVRRPVDTLILRQAGSLFATTSDGDIVNFYTVQLFNRTAVDRPFAIVATWPVGARVTALGPLAHVQAHGLLDTRLMVSVPASSLSGAASPLRFEVRVAGTAPQIIESSIVALVKAGAAGSGE